MHTVRDTAAVSADPSAGTRRHLLSDLRSPYWLGRWPTIGLLLVIIGGGVFGLMTISLQTNANIWLIDLQWVNSLHTVALNSPPLITSIFIFGFYAGEHVIVGIAVIMAVYFLYKRFWPEFITLVIAWGGEAAMGVYLADHFNRPRPYFTVEVWHLMTGPGYPSGHSFAALLCYSWIAYLIVPRLSSRGWKIAVIVVAGLLILYVGFSRVYIGDHYPTDVLSGYALGIGWSGIVYTSVEVATLRYRERRAARSNLQKVA